MCILYKKATKEFVHFDTKTKRSDLITDIRLASELTNAEAKELLKKCTKKTKRLPDNTDRVFSGKRTGSTGYCDSSAASRNNDNGRRVSAAGAGNADGRTAAGSSAVSEANISSASNDSADYKNTKAMLHKQRTKRNLYKG